MPIQNREDSSFIDMELNDGQPTKSPNPSLAPTPGKQHPPWEKQEKPLAPFAVWKQNANSFVFAI